MVLFNVFLSQENLVYNFKLYKFTQFNTDGFSPENRLHSPKL